MANPFTESVAPPAIALGDRVRFIPREARGEACHPACRDGVVSGFGVREVFVKFDNMVTQNGWTMTVAERCDPSSLMVI